MPVAVGSIAGCEGGAVMGGSVDGSIPSSALGLTSGTGDAAAAGVAVALGVETGQEVGVLVAGGWAAGGFARPPRSRGVYSVVNDGCGATVSVVSVADSKEKRERAARPFGGAVAELVLRAAGLVGLRRDELQKCERRKNYTP